MLEEVRHAVDDRILVARSGAHVGRDHPGVQVRQLDGDDAQAVVEDGLLDGVVHGAAEDNRGCAVSTTTGRRKVKVVPAPTALSQVSWPPCSWAISCAMARPRPVPRSLVVKNGSKIRCRRAGSMPGPVSRTSMSTAPSPPRVETFSEPPPGMASRALR